MFRNDYVNPIRMDELKCRISYLKKVIDEKTGEINKKNGENSFGKIRSIKHGNTYQYYIRNSTLDKNGSYITKDKINIVSDMVQLEYDKRLLEDIKRELKMLIAVKKCYEKYLPEDEYRKMSIGKQQLIKPIRTTDKQYIKEWLDETYQPLGFKSDDTEMYADNGIRMRSKSEIIIAGLLERMKIPYKYEKPLRLNGYGIVHPDFTLLDVKNRREVYYEHLGILDDADYLNKALLKIRLYEKNSIYLGQSLILSGETANTPLDVKSIEKRIRQIIDC